MNISNYELGPIRPPDEAESLLIRTTRGCPWNRCSFCTLFKGMPFSIRTVAEIKNDIIAAKASHKGRTIESCFLQDGDSFAMKTGDLVEVLQALKDAFPALKQVSSYGRAQSMLRKSADEMKEIYAAGLNMLYCGIESGADEVLKLNNKGVGSDIIIESALKARGAGMKLMTFVILGLGGREFSAEHVSGTAAVLNKINPDTIRIMSLAVKQNTDLMKHIEDGTFTMLSEEEMVLEQKNLLESLAGIDSHYRNYHGINLLREVDGFLPQDQDKLLAVINDFLSFNSEEKLNYIFGRRLGYYQNLSDLENSSTYGLIQKRVDEIAGAGAVSFEEIFHDLRSRII